MRFWLQFVADFQVLGIIIRSYANPNGSIWQFESKSALALSNVCSLYIFTMVTW